MGNVTGSLTGSFVGWKIAGRRGRVLGGIVGGILGAVVELGHILARHIHLRGKHEIAVESARRSGWVIEELGVRYCPLNVVPGRLNMMVDVLRHILAPFGSLQSGVFRHDWVAATVRSPTGEKTYLIAKKCGDGNIVVTWSDTIHEADEAGIDIIKGCKKGLSTSWQRRVAGKGRTVKEFINKVLDMRPTYNMIVDNCQDFARGILTWHDRKMRQSYPSETQRMRIDQH